MRRYLFICFLVCAAIFFVSNSGQAQRLFCVKWKEISTKNITIQSFSDSLQASYQIEYYIKQLQRLGFAAAQIDSSYWKNDTLNVIWFQGEKYEWWQLKTDSTLPQDWLRKNIKALQIGRLGKVFQYDLVQKQQQQLIEWSENKGFPFAMTYLDSIQVHENRQVSAVWRYSSGAYITNDTLHVEGDLGINRKFLAGYLRLKKGEPFSQNKVKESEKLLKRLPYVKTLQPPQVSFLLDMAQPTFFLNKQKNNQLDFVAGLLPNANNNNRLVLTGQLDLLLQNLFKLGQKLEVNWLRPRANTQLLKLNYEYPIIAGTPLGTQIDFFLQREDTFFLTRKYRITFNYHMGVAGALGFFVDDQVSSRLSAAAVSIPMSENNIAIQNSDLAGYQLTQYGISYKLDDTDDLFFPKKGLKAYSEMGIGNKNIRSLPTGVTVSETQTIQWNTLHRWSYFLPTGKKSTWLNGIQAAWTWNENLFVNDLYRLGGIRTMRGFNENFFFASGYAIFTTEWRYFLEKNAYLLLFCDTGYIEVTLKNKSSTNEWATGVGTGFSLDTGKGIFNFAYSLGYAKLQPFGLRYSKIHFGLRSRF